MKKIQLKDNKYKHLMSNYWKIFHTLCFYYNIKILK